jgi:hypothetical protein
MQVDNVCAVVFGMSVQLVLAGKIRPAAMCATAAYRDSQGFKEATGIENTELVDEKTVDTKVCPVNWRLHGLL